MKIKSGWAARVTFPSGHRAIRRLWLSALLLLLLAVPAAPPASVSADLAVIAGDDFETSSYTGGSGWSTGWNVSTAAKIVAAGQPHSGARHLEMRGSAVASRMVDLSAWSNVELSFWAKASSLEASDFIALEVSPDGITWEALETWVNGDDDNRYHLYEFDDSAQVISETLWFRFLSQMDEPSDYFYVDDVLIQGEPAPEEDTASVVTSIPVSPVISSLSAAASGGIVIDGSFSDWAGYPNLSDPAGDASKVRGDLSAFYWANNGGTEVNFWMIERYPGNGNPGNDYDDNGGGGHDDDDGWGGGDDDDDNEYSGGGGNWQTKKVKYTIYLDTNDDGNFSGSNDRRVLVDYHPKSNYSKVRVRVKPGTGGQTLYSAEGDWGESAAEGGRRVELAAFWQDLGITHGNVVRMYLESNWDDRLPNSGDIQWSPASILGFWLLSAASTVGAVALWRLKKHKEQQCLSGRE